MLQFHKWAAELEAACASETEDKYKRYADLLTAHLRTAEGILEKVRPTPALLGRGTTHGINHSPQSLCHFRDGDRQAPYARVVLSSSAASHTCPA